MTRPMFRHHSGIYQIRNLLNGNKYIGQSANLVTRRYNHFRLLRTSRHHTPYLQSAFNKYGENNFIFEVLVYCGVNDLDRIEQEVVNKLYPTYNSRLDVTSNRGHKVSDETKRKISISNTGLKRSDVVKENMSKARKGRKVSEETRGKMSERAKGNTLRKGHSLTAAHKKRISEANRRRIRKPISDETRQRMSDSAKGHKNALGHKASNETRKKESEIRKEWWRRKRCEPEVFEALVTHLREINHVYWSQQRAKK